MTAKSIFYPVIALVLFTLAVGLRVLQTRIGALKRKRINPQALADGKRWDEILGEVEGPADAFENLFEVPILFYTVTLALFVTSQVRPYQLVAAWLFVFFRVCQGWIHCTYNRIMHRAMSYWMGCIILLVMWAGFAVNLIFS